MQIGQFLLNLFEQVYAIADTNLELGVLFGCVGVAWLVWSYSSEPWEKEWWKSRDEYRQSVRYCTPAVLGLFAVGFVAVWPPSEEPEFSGRGPITELPKSEQHEFGPEDAGRTIQLGQCPSRFCLYGLIKETEWRPDGVPLLPIELSGVWGKIFTSGGHGPEGGKILIRLPLIEGCSVAFHLKSDIGVRTLQWMVAESWTERNPRFRIVAAILEPEDPPFPELPACETVDITWDTRKGKPLDPDTPTVPTPRAE